jgi:hypothetical protein
MALENAKAMPVTVPYISTRTIAKEDKVLSRRLVRKVAELRRKGKIQPAIKWDPHHSPIGRIPYTDIGV